MTSFAALGVDPRLVDALERAGITAPFAIQALTIPDAVAGRDVCGKAKTGSGKTLAFGLPLLAIAGGAEANHPHAVVLVPTRELALQVSEVLAPLGEAVGCRVVAVYGGASMERQRASLASGADVLVATPGRLIDFIDNDAVRLDAVRSVVLDEADRMADMGFLPQVEWLLRRITASHQTLLFSATLDGAVDHVVRRHLKDPVFHEVLSTTVTVDEMAHRFVLVHQLDKVKVAAAITRNVTRTLVFVRTKRGADRLARRLEQRGVRAAAMHGDLNQSQRQRALERFESGKVTTLIATDVAARGLDLDNVTHVINFDPPEDGKAYTHRVGRTGRAGRSGTGVTLVLPEQQADMSRVARLNGQHETFVETGMKTAAPKLVYSSRRRSSKWGPVRARRKI